jgi:hypothetical protein
MSLYLLILDNECCYECCYTENIKYIQISFNQMHLFLKFHIWFDLLHGAKYRIEFSMYICDLLWMLNSSKSLKVTNFHIQKIKIKLLMVETKLGQTVQMCRLAWLSSGDKCWSFQGTSMFRHQFIYWKVRRCTICWINTVNKDDQHLMSWFRIISNIQFWMFLTRFFFAKLSCNNMKNE